MLKLSIALAMLGLLLLCSCASNKPCYKQQNFFFSKTVI